MKDIIQPTIKCSECYYFKLINGVKTCGLGQSFLQENVTGCYGGWKQRNVDAETK
mgnify:CR=1 FL=1|jgi:hypothetical protein